jgi:hypothetical protein
MLRKGKRCLLHLSFILRDKISPRLRKLYFIYRGIRCGCQMFRHYGKQIGAVVCKQLGSESTKCGGKGRGGGSKYECNLKKIQTLTVWTELSDIFTKTHIYDF